MHSPLKKDGYILALMLITVPLAGELKFYPVNETFRISFGAPTFFFFLLLFQRLPAVLPGFLTGLSVVGFRLLLDSYTHSPFHLATSMQEHYSSFFFYFSYSLLFYVIRMERFRERTLIIGGIGMVIEVVADLVELLSQYVLFHIVVTWSSLQEMFVIALSHSFVVLSFLNMIRLYETQAREKQTRAQHEHMLMLISNLYEESIHLKKTLQNAENITVKSFELYQRLQAQKDGLEQASVDSFARQALIIAGEVHEIKKDNQRIFAGLQKLITHENRTDFMDIHQLADIIVRSQRKYASLLGKNIEFTCLISGEHPPYHVFTLMSLINNIVANAVEAIQKTGSILIQVNRDKEFVEIKIADDGPGVPPRRKKLLFKPGFTTKYDDKGAPSTGIGLSYVKEMVDELQGELVVGDGAAGKGTEFVIRLPINLVREKEGDDALLLNR
ncbi:MULTISPECIES: sensor histidine kinase [Brevibacillus]|jgi:Signal transduction histidine kinase|uniref:sensor histidine kinase n=1 Tax=Brevibacillus TaxID=55080 RepID=UPI002492F3D2|nr:MULTISPECIES: sensor histidine kinase [Brevibacillus]